ncbi:MAG: hypothetical protein RH917_13325 [Lacipirellulaceae bacterium]
MTIKLGLATVISCFFAGVVAGGLIGYLVGSLSPSLIPALVPTLPEGVNLREVAVSLGLINGAWGGLAVGIALTVVVAWFESRKLNNK